MYGHVIKHKEAKQKLKTLMKEFKMNLEIGIDSPELDDKIEQVIGKINTFDLEREDSQRIFENGVEIVNRSEKKVFGKTEDGEEPSSYSYHNSRIFSNCISLS